jgi:hypothetical protein
MAKQEQIEALNHALQADREPVRKMRLVSAFRQYLPMDPRSDYLLLCPLDEAVKIVRERLGL